MLPNPYVLEQLIVDRREALTRAADQARLARLAGSHADRAPRPRARAQLANALRSLADRLEPAAARACEVGSSPMVPRRQEMVR